MSLHTYREDGDGLPVVLLHGFPSTTGCGTPWRPRSRRDAPCTRSTCSARPAVRTTCRSPRSRRLPTTSRRPCARPASSARWSPACRWAATSRSLCSSGTPTWSPGSPWWTRSRPPTPPRRAPTGSASRARWTRRARSTRSDRWRRRSWVRRRAADPEIADEIGAWIDQQEPAGIAWSQRAMAARPDRSEVLSAYRGPVLVVVGDEDTVTPVEAAEHLVATAAEARLVVIPARRAPVGRGTARRGSSGHRRSGPGHRLGVAAGARRRWPPLAAESSAASGPAPASAPPTCPATRRPCRPHRSPAGERTAPA